MTASIAASGTSLHGFFSRDLAPVAELDPGESVEIETLDAWWSAGPYQGGAPADRARVPEHTTDAGHALSGPIFVRGARAGATLAVRLDSIVPGAYGTTVAGGRPVALDQNYGIADRLSVLTWELDARAATGRNNLGHTVALRPFLGVIGVAPAEPGPHSTIPPRSTGGNLDCKELVEGSTLYLPIAVDGALLSVGDGHARQGDGEVCGTAIECPMHTRLTVDVREDFPIRTPVADTPAGWVTMGVADTLDDAALVALNAMFDLMQHRLGLNRADAVTLASVVVDLRVTQIVNQVVGAHAVLAPDAIG
jgi:acetamidase/formamidase